MSVVFVTRYRIMCISKQNASLNSILSCTKIFRIECVSFCDNMQISFSVNLCYPFENPCIGNVKLIQFQFTKYLIFRLALEMCAKVFVCVAFFSLLWFALQHEFYLVHESYFNITTSSEISSDMAVREKVLVIFDSKLVISIGCMECLSTFDRINSKYVSEFMFWISIFSILIFSNDQITLQGE